MKRTFEHSDDIADALDKGETIERESWRHGTKNTIVFEYEGKHWRTVVPVHHSEGWELTWPIEATEVHQVEKLVKVWEPV